MKSHKNLDVWKRSIQLVTDIYKVTMRFPEDEKFGLTAQVRRAAISIPSNISEGSARGSKKEFIRFLYIAQGSLAEVDTQIIIAKNLMYLDDVQYETLISEFSEIGKMIYGLINYLDGK